MNEEQWEALNRERIFGINEHLIWKIEELEENIKTPDGYKEIKTDKVSYLRKIYIRKFFVNIIPVKASLYINNTTKEISYYFEGTPIKQNQLVKGKQYTKDRKIKII